MLDEELKFLESHRDELLRHYGGKYLVIRGGQVTGAFDTMEEALRGSAAKHGLSNVLIRRASEPQVEVSVPAPTLGILNADSAPPSG